MNSDNKTELEMNSDSASEEESVCSVFSDACGGCAEQHDGCPCNSCFHSLPDEADWKHISWLLLLAFRGDHEPEEVIPSLREELVAGKEALRKKFDEK